MEEERICTLVVLFGRQLSSPALGVERLLLLSWVKEALEESKSALCFFVPLPNMPPSVH